MPRKFLKDLLPGDLVDDVFVITQPQLAATGSNKHFIKAFISDRSAQVTARMWNASRDLFNAIPESGFVRARGRVENYQGNLQFVIEQLGEPSPGSFDIADLLPHTPKDIDTLVQRLFALMDTLKRPQIRTLVQAFLDDEDLMNNFAKAPAAVSFHHAYIGGLLEHTINCLDVAESALKFYPALDRDLVLAGLFLHDIAKTWELVYDASFAYSDGGQLIGHLVRGAMWIEQKAAACPTPISPEIVIALQHIVLAHHGPVELGSARPPQTPEAYFVHLIDNMDAKMFMALHATRAQETTDLGGNWTEFIKPLGTRLYRAMPAAAEAGAMTTPIVDRHAAVSRNPVVAAAAPAPATPRPAVAAVAPGAARNGTPPQQPAPRAIPAPVSPTSFAPTPAGKPRQS